MTLGGAFRSLQVRNYRLFLVSQLVSVSGTAMQQVAQDWLVVQLTGHAFSVGIASVLQFLPVFVFAPWGGVLADGIDKRTLLMITQTALGTLAFVLALLSFTESVRLWTIYLLAGALGCATGFDMPARQSFVSDMVGPDRIANAVALNNGALNAARVIGPAAAGALIGTLGVATAFLLNALSYLAVIAGLRVMDATELHRAQHGDSAKRKVGGAIACLRERPHLAATMLLTGVVAAVALNYQVVLPLLTRVAFRGDAGLFATLMASLAAGSVIGALLAAAATTPSRRLQNLAAFALSLLTMLAATAPNRATAALTLVLVGIASGAALSLTNSYLQMQSPPPLRARLIAINGVVYRTGLIGGALVIGWLADRVGPRDSLRVAAAVMVVATLLLALYGTRHGTTRLARAG